MAIGLLCTIVPSLGGVVALAAIKYKPRQWRQYLPLLVYCIFIAAYCFSPFQFSNRDLVRYIEMIEECGRLSFKEAIAYFNDILYVRTFLFWICGRIHMPHLAPAFTTGIIYAVMGYITCDIADEYDAGKNTFYVIMIQLLLIPFFSVVCNIRNVFSFSLISLAAYWDIYKKKRTLIVFILYLLGCFMHLSAIVLIVIRILCPAVKRFFGAFFVIPVLFGPFIKLVYRLREIIPSDNRLGATLVLIIVKANGYLLNDYSSYAVHASKSLTFRVTRVLTMFEILLFVVLIYYFLRVNDKHLKGNHNLYSFAALVAIVTLACNAFTIPNYWRFAAIFFVISGIVFIPAFKYFKEYPVFIQSVIIIIIIVAPSLIGMEIWQYRSLFSWSKWLVDCMTTNIFTLFYQFLKGFILA